MKQLGVIPTGLARPPADVARTTAAEPQPANPT